MNKFIKIAIIRIILLILYWALFLGLVQFFQIYIIGHHYLGRTFWLLLYPFFAGSIARVILYDKYDSKKLFPRKESIYLILCFTIILLLYIIYATYVYVTKSNYPIEFL